MGKRKLDSDAEVKAEVDGLLGTFGVLGEAEGDFADGALPRVDDGAHLAPLPPSASADALWGAAPKKKK